MEKLIRIEDVARVLDVSKGTAYRYIRAQKYAGKPESEVPEDLRGYTDSGFPAPVFIGKQGSGRGIRIAERKFQEWLARKVEGQA